MGEAVTVDLKQSMPVRGFFYTPNPVVQSPNIYRYDLYLSEDGERWVQVKGGARFDNIANNPVRQEVAFDDLHTARYLRIVPLESVGGRDVCEVVEVGALTR